MFKKAAVAVALALAIVPIADAQVTGTPSAQLGALSQDVSDLWWNPSESGWGIQLNQMGGVVFATLYVYDASNRPTWFTAQLSAAQGSGQYTGPLYSSTGPYYGAGSFNAGSVTRTQVGTMTFAMQSDGTATLTYTANGTAVTKSVQRQTLVNANLTGTYQVQGTVTSSGCTDPSNSGTVNGTSTVQIADVGGNARQVTWIFPNGNTCVYSGSQTQAGRFGSLNGATYTCSSGETGTLDFSGLSSSGGSFGGQVSGSTNSLGCTVSGRFSGIDPQFQFGGP
jgi:hypothetical protein